VSPWVLVTRSYEIWTVSDPSDRLLYLTIALGRITLLMCRMYDVRLLALPS
jgi:hypothetical protein